MGDDSTNRYIAGRIVDPNGTVGSEFRISTGYGAASDVAFDGSNFFVVWCEDSLDTEIRGRFVSPAGVPGTEWIATRLKMGVTSNFSCYVRAVESSMEGLLWELKKI